LIRRLSDLFYGGHFDYKKEWKKEHLCPMPYDRLFIKVRTGDIWQCKCGKRYECTGWEPFGTFRRWSELTEIEGENV
jgi:hypothetical protein